MQEIRDNISVDPCSNLPNESMWPYLVVTTYLMELLWNFSSCLGQLKGGRKSHQKKIFEVDMFFSSQNIDFPFI
jgi:hypothetical protein